MSTKSRNRGMTRRQFFRITAITGTGVIVTACAPAAPAPAPEAQVATEAPAAEAPAATEAPAAEAPAAEAPAAAASKYKEAPMLAELVQAGSLPPVDQRLPANPHVMPTLESIGKYGGTVRRGFRGVSDRWGPTKMQDRTFTWFDKSLTLQPRLIESWEVSEDGKETTFRLRPGTKWSDGAPFTTADVKWWYDNFLTNKELLPAPDGWAMAGTPRQVMELEIIDDNTFKAKFVVPNPLFPYRVTRNLPAMPGHYLKQYHMDLTDDKAKLEAEVKEKGFESWATYFEQNRRHWFYNPELPTVGPWLSKNDVSNELFEMARNPYFFAVDSEGNQLPYIDKVNHRLFETPDVFDLRIVNGEIDFQARHVQTGNFTLYKESEEKGGYKVLNGVAAGHVGLNPNHSSKNPLLAEFFQNRDVRIAMNLAMNREEINELVWSGLLTPRQYSPLSLSPQYNEKAANAYIQHDPAEANRLLDAAGYDKKGPDGFRLWKDGSGPVSFIIEGIFATGSNEDDTAQLVTKYLGEVGIQATYKPVERSLYEERYNANDVDCGFWGGDRTVLPLVPEAPIFRGTMIDRPWASGWGIYFNIGKDDPNAVAPPEGYFINKIWELWDQIAVEPSPDKQNALFAQIMDIWAEEVPMVTLLGEAPSLAIVKNGFRNFVAGFPNDDTTGDENVYNTETYFWEDPESHSG